MDYKRKLRNVVNKAIGTGEKLVKKGEQQIAIFRLEGAVDELTSSLGKKCYELLSSGKDPGADKGASELVGRITDIKNQIESLKNKNACPTCGFNLPPEAKFCPRCGKEVK